MSTSIDETTVDDLILPPERTAILPPDALFERALAVMSQCHLGMCCVLDDQKNILGVLTDGDVRRAMLKFQGPSSALFVKDALSYSNANPIKIGYKTSAREALRIMGEKQVWDLPVVDHNEKFLGIVHLHSITMYLLAQSDS